VAKICTSTDIFVKATSEELRSNKAFMHQAVKLNLLLLQCASPDMRVDLAVSVAFGNDGPTIFKKLTEQHRAVILDELAKLPALETVRQFISDQCDAVDSIRFTVARRNFYFCVGFSICEL